MQSLRRSGDYGTLDNHTEPIWQLIQNIFYNSCIACTSSIYARGWDCNICDLDIVGDFRYIGAHVLVMDENLVRCLETLSYCPTDCAEADYSYAHDEF